MNSSEYNYKGLSRCIGKCFRTREHNKGNAVARDHREVVSQFCHTSPFFKLRGKWFYHDRIYRKNIPKDYHFCSKLWKTVKSSPCFKFLVLSQLLLIY